MTKAELESRIEYLQRIIDKQKSRLIEQGATAFGDDRSNEGQIEALKWVIVSKITLGRKHKQKTTERPIE